MNGESHQLAVYLSLSRASERRQRPHVRDRMLVLAGIQAVRMQLFQLSQYCRTLILEHNPKHFVGRWSSIAEGLQHEAFVQFVKPISRRYPLERAEQLLYSLGIEISNERATYYDDVEYAAAILGINPDQISDTPPEQSED